MQQVRKFRGNCVTLRVGKERPRFDERDLRVAFDRGGIELIDLLDFVGRPRHPRRTRKYLAKHDRHFSIVPRQLGNYQLEIAGNRFRVRVFFEIIRADQQDNCLRLQREDIFLQPDEHATRSVAADPAIGDLHAGKPGREIVAPAFSNRIAEHHDGVAILVRAVREFGAALVPRFAEPVVTANRALAGQAFVGFGKLKTRGRWFVLCARGRTRKHEGQSHQGKADGRV